MFLVAEAGEFGVVGVVGGDELVFAVEDGGVGAVAVVLVAELLGAEVDLEAAVDGGVGVGVEGGDGEGGDFGAVGVEFDGGGVVGASVGAGGAAFVEAEEGGEVAEEAGVDEEVVVGFLADRAGLDLLVDVGLVAEVEEHEVGGVAGLLVAAEEAFEVVLGGGVEVFEFGAGAEVAEGEVDEKVVAALVGDVIPGVGVGGLEDEVEGLAGAAELALEVGEGVEFVAEGEASAIGVEGHEGLEEFFVVLEATDVGADAGGAGAGTEAGGPEGLGLAGVAEDDVDSGGHGDGLDRLVRGPINTDFLGSAVEDLVDVSFEFFLLVVLLEGVAAGDDAVFVGHPASVAVVDEDLGGDDEEALG